MVVEVVAEMVVVEVEAVVAASRTTMIVEDVKMVDSGGGGQWGI